MVISFILYITHEFKGLERQIENGYNRPNYQILLILILIKKSNTENIIPNLSKKSCFSRIKIVKEMK